LAKVDAKVDDSLFVIKIISTTVRFFQPSLFIALKAILLNAEDAERRRERKNGAKECDHCEAGVRGDLSAEASSEGGSNPG